MSCRNSIDDLIMLDGISPTCSMTTMTPSARSTRSSPTKGTPLHRQLFLVLRDQIASGVYKPGEALPKEEALCEQFSVSRITVRRAMSDLFALDLVERRHAQGAFVRGDAPLMRPIPSLSFMDGLKKAAMETDIKVLAVTQAEPPREVAQLLHIAPGERAVRIHRLRSIDKVPVLLLDSWIPSAFGDKLTAATVQKTALYELLVDQGIKFGRMIQEISASVADPEKAKLLRTEVGAPLLKLVRVMHDTKDKPIQYLLIYMSPDRSRILTDIPGNWINTMNAGQIVHDPH